jgi:hypothetical protein
MRRNHLEAHSLLRVALLLENRRESVPGYSEGRFDAHNLGEKFDGLIGLAEGVVTIGAAEEIFDFGRGLGLGARTLLKQRGRVSERRGVKKSAIYSRKRASCSSWACRC